MANRALIQQITVISNTLEYWEKEDPVLPLYTAAYVSDAPSRGLRVSKTGTEHWSQLKDTTSALISTPPHKATHAIGGRDVLLPSDIGASAEDHTHSEFLTLSTELLTKAPLESPVFTGEVTIPLLRNAVTDITDRSNKPATTSFVHDVVDDNNVQAKVMIVEDYDRTEIVLASTDYLVPNYMVGKGRIAVFLDGVKCSQGTDPDKDTFVEIGDFGTFSTCIHFNQDIPIEYNITIEVW